MSDLCTCNPERPGDCRSFGCDPECRVCEYADPHLKASANPSLKGSSPMHEITPTQAASVITSYLASVESNTCDTHDAEYRVAYDDRGEIVYEILDVMFDLGLAPTSDQIDKADDIDVIQDGWWDVADDITTAVRTLLRATLRSRGVVECRDSYPITKDDRL